MNGKKQNVLRRVASLEPPQIIVLSFAAIITVGTVLLLLPWSVHEGNLSLIDALFTSVSATCVTGLTVINTGSQLTLYGQIVVLSLIQIGGLGIMTFSTFFLYLFRKRVSLRGKDAIDNTLSHTPVRNIGSLLSKIMITVFSIELAGVICLTVAWSRYYPIHDALYNGIFHSISAFCNAGFSLFNNSFESFRSDFFINSVVMILIILGGLGFIVLLDLKNIFSPFKRKTGGFSFHSKVVITVTLFLIVFGALSIFLIERNHIFYGVVPRSSVLISLFQSITARTAGFNTVEIGSLTNGTCFILMILMFIGAAPGSCGGGVKVSTVGILVAMLLSRLRGHEDPHLFYRTIPGAAAGKALVIVLSSVILIGVVFWGLLLTEEGSIHVNDSRGNFLVLLFEAISAFGTVGLSMGVTNTLTVMGKILIIILMFVGRLGPLTMAIALTSRSGRQAVRFRYAMGEIMVG